MQITSPKNPLLQDIRRAAHAGRPTENGHVVLEGPHLLEEALRSAWSVSQVFATPEARAHWPNLFSANVPFIEVAERALAATASTETTQGVLALAGPTSHRIEDMLTRNPLLLVLDGLQDPGNAGTLVRSAEAFGATGIIACRGSVHLANGKFLRATAGSVFRLPYIETATSDEALLLLRRSGVNVYALDARASLTFDRADLRSPCAFVVGNEGHGLSTAFSTSAVLLAIPSSKIESLNAAIAGSIVLYETARQRGLT